MWASLWKQGGDSEGFVIPDDMPLAVVSRVYKRGRNGTESSWVTSRSIQVRGDGHPTQDRGQKERFGICSTGGRTHSDGVDKREEGETPGFQR